MVGLSIYHKMESTWESWSDIRDNPIPLGGWTNPSEKYFEIGSWNPKFRGENKNFLKPPPSI